MKKKMLFASITIGLILLVSLSINFYFSYPKEYQNVLTNQKEITMQKSKGSTYHIKNISVENGDFLRILPDKKSLKKNQLIEIEYQRKRFSGGSVNLIMIKESFLNKKVTTFFDGDFRSKNKKRILIPENGKYTLCLIGGSTEKVEIENIIISITG